MNDLESGQLLCVRCDDLPWKPSTFAAGVFVKDVAVTGGLEMQIVRLEPAHDFRSIPMNARNLYTCLKASSYWEVNI